MSELAMYLLAALIGLAGAAVGALMVYWLTNLSAKRRARDEEQARAETVQALAHAVRDEVKEQVSEGIAEFAQTMEERRLKEVVKTLEFATLSRTILIEELRLQALKRALIEATEDNPELRKALEATVGQPVFSATEPSDNARERSQADDIPLAEPETPPTDAPAEPETPTDSVSAMTAEEAVESATLHAPEEDADAGADVADDSLREAGAEAESAEAPLEESTEAADQEMDRAANGAGHSG